MNKFLDYTGLQRLVQKLITAFSNYVPVTRKINSKKLTSDITLTANDLGAAASSSSVKYKRFFVNGPISVGETIELPFTDLPKDPTYSTVFLGQCPYFNAKNFEFKFESSIKDVQADVDFGTGETTYFGTIVIKALTEIPATQIADIYLVYC